MNGESSDDEDYIQGSERMTLIPVTQNLKMFQMKMWKPEQLVIRLIFYSFCDSWEIKLKEFDIHPAMDTTETVTPQKCFELFFFRM